MAKVQHMSVEIQLLFPGLGLQVPECILAPVMNGLIIIAKLQTSHSSYPFKANMPALKW